MFCRNKFRGFVFDTLRFTAVVRCGLLLGLLSLPVFVGAAVLPEERADLLYHRYDGGGAEIEGPSLLVRKNLGDSVSVGLNHYVDNVTSASIDVLVSASKYTENREENGLNLDYLRQKTTMSLGYVESQESDFDAATLSLGISQDMFGDLTTVSMSFAFGDNIVGQNGDDSFEESAEVRSYRLGLTQILTKSLVMAMTLETITDEGYLNNPYRSVRYRTGPDSYSFQQEIYPRTRTSNAVAVRGNYFLPQRAAIHAGVRYFEDSWDIEATTYEVGYTMPFGETWILEARYRLHDQSAAEFYSDLFPFIDAQSFLARDKELSTFTSTTLGLGASYEFGRAWTAIERGSLNLSIDWIQFDYDDFRDLTDTAAVGEESLYSFDATVTRLFASIWF
ncbi:MAG: DUF3570 domain-containing protein [Gammaproteobacteria bacterium]|nr:DUF3570 domain-containing protein [Gammaproteobacteria bacterium]